MPSAHLNRKLYWGYIGIMEKKMETIIFWGYIGIVWGYIGILWNDMHPGAKSLCCGCHSLEFRRAPRNPTKSSMSGTSPTPQTIDIKNHA